MMQDFYHALMEKFYRVAREKNRSLEPWDDYDAEFLWNRLQEEWKELKDSCARSAIGENDRFITVYKAKDIDQDELIDVAAFCSFLWLRLEYLKEEKHEVS